MSPAFAASTESVARQGAFLPKFPWRATLALRERLAAGEEWKAGHSPPGESASERGRRRLERWRSQAPFHEPEYFLDRLALDGLDEAGLGILLSEGGAEVDRPSGQWSRILESLERSIRTGSPRSLHLPRPPLPPGHPLAFFLGFVRPIAEDAHRRLLRRLRTIHRRNPEVPFEPQRVADLIVGQVQIHLADMANRVLLLQLNIERFAGTLQGVTPEARFRSFIERLERRDEAWDLYCAYPVLARQMVMRAEALLQAGSEFVSRLCADWADLRWLLSPDGQPGGLSHLGLGHGDRHRGGRAVVIAEFETGCRLVYKPRSLAVDRHFQALLHWLNERGADPPFRTIWILDSGRYGWQEFVPHKECADLGEIERFYCRQGAYLALFHALNATDFHVENLIACGEHPVPVDLETLFHPRPPAPERPGHEPGAVEFIERSVLHVGLLPWRLAMPGDEEWVDLSGLGAPSGQFSPRGVPAWEGVGTDSMRFVRKRVALGKQQNRPVHNGVTADVLAHAEALVAGFRGLYRLLLAHRNELLAPAGPLACFATDEVRVILRLSRTYGLLLQDSFHPDFLRDALDRDRHFDRLWSAVPHQPLFRRVIPSEHRELLRGDIPYFVSQPASRDLWVSQGQRLRGFFATSAIEDTFEGLRTMGAADLERQVWCIRSALATVPDADDRSRWARPVTPASVEGAGTEEKLLDLARKVGDRISDLAMESAGDRTWFGLVTGGRRHLAFEPLGCDLYGGLPGIVLFFAQLATVTGEERYRSLAEGGLRSLRRALERTGSGLTSIGAFSGWGGLIYLWIHLGLLWDEPGLFAEAQGMVERLPVLIPADEQLDVIGGSAGCLLVLLGLERIRPGAALAAARLCGDRLLETAQKTEHGLGWVTRSTAKPLTGLSHGAAGFAWALSELAGATRDERYAEAAREALAFERSLFHAPSGNWEDRRDFDLDAPASQDDPSSGLRFMVAWCHGAPGIGLSRLRSLRGDDKDDKTALAEIETALATTLAVGFGGNHSLCHGDLGNLELLIQAEERLKTPRWGRERRRIAARLAAGIQADGWLCGVPLGTETPGLMTGLAGIGHGLLRAALPSRVSPILTLSLPEHPTEGEP